MSSNKKTIKINLDDFGMKPKRKSQSRNKTIKASPVLKPNALKKKLIERIKHHKTKDSKTKNSTHSTFLHDNTNMSTTSYHDEFNDSLKYLSNLASERDNSSPYPKTTPRTRTSKLAHTTETPYVHVELDLPAELQNIQSVSPSAQGTSSSITLSSPSSTNYVSPPYGCLKGGAKPTYRTWNKTIRNTSSHNVSETRAPIVIENNNSQLQHSDTNQPSDRELRLQKLKDKFKEQSVPTFSRSPQVGIADTNPELIIKDDIPTTPSMIDTFQPMLIPEVTELSFPKASTNEPIHYDTPIVIKRPSRTKKTITKKYKLGKQEGKRRVGVLIKDKHTRKKVLDAQRAIRRKSLVEVKSYLHDHGLIKVGSTAPTDVVRKIYESSMMTGDINNQDSDIVAYNLMKSEEAL